MITVLKKLLLITIVLSFQGNAQQTNFSKLDEFLNILNENKKFMGTMTITKQGKDVYHKAVGLSDIASTTKNSNLTKFRIGSITKVFTATMIFQLIEEGKITLETPLSKFYPTISQADTIKIANLLNHSSGLFNITNDPNVSEWMLRYSSKKMMLPRIFGYDLDFNPGEQTVYSNTNYILLGYIIELLDSSIYAQSLEARITKKINLEHTYYGKKINTNNNESHSYTKDNENWLIAQETDMSNPGGAGAIVSTSQDLTKFMNALFDGKLISQSSLEAMKKTNNDEVCHGITYANLNGVDLYASEGGIDGFQSLLVHMPSTKTTIALVANGLDFTKIRIILSALAASQGKPITLPVFTKIELTEEQVTLYVGEYACDEVPFKLIFEAKGNILFGAPEHSDLKELTPTKQHQFTLDPLGVTLEFYPETGVVKFNQPNSEPLIFNKI